jgi:outer membrane lipoprotein-sorting protein
MTADIFKSCERAIAQVGQVAQVVRMFLIVIALAALTISALAQKADPKDPNNVRRGQELIKQAIEARGGVRYLTFRSVEATGQFTQYEKGISQIPIQFLDIIVYPDKERVEFGKGKKKNKKIQVNAGKTGWIYDGDAETIKDQTDKQIQNYVDGLAFDLDRLLRSGWKEEGVAVGYAGREETRPGERADVVALEMQSDRKVQLLLDPKTHLPMSLIYEKPGDEGLIKHEVRFNQYVPYDGALFPNIIDFYRNGIQESRLNYQSVKLDPKIDDDIFTKPASVKAIK